MSYFNAKFEVKKILLSFTSKNLNLILSIECLVKGKDRTIVLKRCTGFLNFSLSVRPYVVLSITTIYV